MKWVYVILALLLVAAKIYFGFDLIWLILGCGALAYLQDGDDGYEPMDPY